MTGTTNILQWNPTATNQETDAAYLADSQRAGGATDPSVFQSILANKAFYQWSTYLTALFAAFAAKGFTTSDSNLSTLTAQCANFLTAADVLPPLLAVPFTATPSFNAALANGFGMVLTGNVTASTITGVTAGQPLTFFFVQDSVGGRTVVYPPSFVGTVQPDPAPNAVSFMLFQADLIGTPRAVGPLVSNNGMFTNAFSASSITLASGAPAGQVLTGNGTSFVAVPQPGAAFSSSSNSFGNTYQNTGTTPRSVIVTGSLSLGVGHTANIQARLGGFSPATNIATSSIMNSSGFASVTFIVPPGYYYGVYTSIGWPGETNPAVLYSWIEYS